MSETEAQELTEEAAQAIEPASEEVPAQPEPEIAAPDSIVGSCECEDCVLEAGQFIREANGVKYLAFTDKYGVSYDIRPL